MDTEDYYQQAMGHHSELGADFSKSWENSVSSSPAKCSDSTDDGFQCNICLDHAHEPVVTLCGHLYCWPCIYKWLHFQSSSNGVSEQQPQCPVCKADVSQSMLVPLYGRGYSLPRPEKDHNDKGSSIEIPSRPSAHGVHALITTSPTSDGTSGNHFRLQSQFQSNQQEQQHHPRFYNETLASFPTSGSATATVAVHPMVGMFGEMMYATARIFGNGSEMGLFVHPNAYDLMRNTSSSPRVRRQEIKIEKSLNRISIFLFCCVILCLLSF
ncbi:hypothetical protein MKW94_000898 [Papaver nudicaule]|uniref:E3 ubiquitin-protein ligase RMA n=1 Tax=Papaver nudicaule TaxID=74823 RepID=A0AA41S6T5_PAPNU|nr:hypothetical protein [Papaver nudicaule]